jgi:hypothetical protein
MGSVDYIFCITTGRSGSDYLSTLFGHVEDCAAFHEPDPQANGRAMRRFSLGDREPMQKVVEQKLAAIRELKGNRSVYVETNHCFIKGFGWLFAERFLDRMGYHPEGTVQDRAELFHRLFLARPRAMVGARARCWDPAVPPCCGPAARHLFDGVCPQVRLRKAGTVEASHRKELPTPRRMLNYELRWFRGYGETEARRAFQERFLTTDTTR